MIKNWSDSVPMDYDHGSEYIVKNYLELGLLRLQRHGTRYTVKRNPDKYKPDLIITKHLNNEINDGDFVCFVEVEQKVNDDFLEYPMIPIRYVRGLSFLKRKVDNEDFNPSDVYGIVNQYPHDKLFWATFAEIKTFGEIYIRDTHNKNDQYYDVHHCNDHNIHRGYDSLSEYIIQLQVVGI